MAISDKIIGGNDQPNGGQALWVSREPEGWPLLTK